MSVETLRPSNHFANVPTAERLAAPRIRAVACAVGLLLLAPAVSLALELGEVALRSGLGQPLLVEIPYRLAADERLTPACISLVPATHNDAALPAYSRVSRIDITPTHIEIFGESRVLEPLLGLTVDVHCATAPHFVRSYELFVDPPGRMPVIPSPAPLVAAAAPIAASAAAANSTRTPPATVSARARGQTGDALTQGQTYVVVRGDTLSGIAARVSRRPTIRATAEAIFAANTEAFTRGNRDLLEAGRTLTIPIMTPATTALPAMSAPEPAPSLTPAPATADGPLSATTPAPAPRFSSVPTSAAQPLGAETTPSVVAPAALEPSPAPVAVEEPSAASAPAAAGVTSEGASLTTTGRISVWRTALLALGVVLVLSVPLLFLRRRKHEAPAPAAAKVREPLPVRLLDPAAGIDVVEESLTHAVLPASLAPRTEATDSVDIDVGEPVMGDDTLEHAATARMPDVESQATVQQQPPEPEAGAAAEPIDDEQHTLTIVEIDMLRQDYEAEHTLTHEASKALRDAVAELKATQAARAATADTATLEMPQQSPDETTETQQTQKLYASR